MLIKYLTTAMHKAHYELLKNDKKFYGEIPGYKGVYATGKTLEDCREELEEVLEEWILFRISRNLNLPVVDGIRLQVKEVA